MQHISSKSPSRHLLKRQTATQIVQQAAYLKEVDKLLLEQVYDLGMPVCKVAKLANQSASVMHKRVHRLLQRIDSGEFKASVSHQHVFTDRQWLVVQAVILQGWTLKQTTTKTGYSLHQVRSLLAQVKGILAMM